MHLYVGEVAKGVALLEHLRQLQRLGVPRREGQDVLGGVGGGEFGVGDEDSCELVEAFAELCRRIYGLANAVYAHTREGTTRGAEMTYRKS